jgi:hypothetical protein
MPSSPQSVATVTLFDYLTSNGTAVPNARVSVMLNSTKPATAITPLVTLMQTQWFTTTDPNGYWQFLLPSNTNISPANTYYTVSTPDGSYDVTLGATGPYQSTAAGTILNVPVPFAPATTPGPITISGNLTVTGVLAAASAAITGAFSAGISTISGLLTAAAGFVISGGTGATLNASGDFAGRSVTVSTGSGPYTSTSQPGTIENIWYAPAPSGTDDTVAVNAVIAACLAAGVAGSIVQFQPGLYKFNVYTDQGTGTFTALQIAKGDITLRGAGWATIFQFGSSNPGANMASISLAHPVQGVGPSYETGLTTYPLNSNTKGANTVTTTTAANAGNFAVGDSILLTGVVARNNYEMNYVVGVNAGTGVINLRYQLAKDFNSGTFTIGKITSITQQNIQFENIHCQFYWQGIIGAQIMGLRIRGCLLEQTAVNGGSNIFQFNYIRDLVIEDNDIFWQSSGANNGIDPAASSMDIRIHNNRITSNANSITIAEGCCHVSVTHNKIYCDDRSGVSNNVAIKCGGGAGNIVIANNDIFYNPTVATAPAIYDASGGTCTQVVIANNTIYLVGVTGNYAIQAASPGTIVSGNSIYSTLGGIWITGAEVEAVGNMIQLTVTGSNGITVQTNHTCRIIGNSILQAAAKAGSGILVVDDGALAVSPTIIGNKIDNFTTGVNVASLAHDPNIQVWGNNVVNCTTAYTAGAQNLLGPTTTIQGGLSISQTLGDGTVITDTGSGGGVRSILVGVGANNDQALAILNTGTGGKRWGLVASNNGSGLGGGSATIYDITDSVAAMNFASTLNTSNLAFATSKDRRISKQAPAFAASPAPDPTAGEIFAMAALTGNVTVANPVNSAQGQRILFIWTQDGTGTRTVTYSGTNWRSVGIAAQNTGATTVTIDEAVCVDGTIWRVNRLVTGQTV